MMVSTEERINISPAFGLFNYDKITFCVYTTYTYLAAVGYKGNAYRREDSSVSAITSSFKNLRKPYREWESL